ncbi:ribonuclease M5 [Priestia flexa]|uniref:ribonuclease M5 n=1 Tax=Priestia flexa TaxID=86664 RepID=UPI000C2381E8|nr:ribonuclease M5 [Priestia flexa]MEC0664630.1 ribonuclease M5 [Priestia flexa]MED3823716.1 ribonuclease M5 [Priestia flexa]
MKIKEIIVVEGRDDTVTIRRAVQADTIETNGSAVNDETIEKIKLAQQTRGVIIFTDPDYPGQRIRNIVSEKVPGCKHAFLSKEQAKGKNGKGIGVEHASVEDIRQALQDVKQEWQGIDEQITQEDLIVARLIGDSEAKSRRERIGKSLKIGYANGKQLHKRLKMFQIPKDEFIKAVQKINQEEQKS